MKKISMQSRSSDLVTNVKVNLGRSVLIIANEIFDMFRLVLSVLYCMTVIFLVSLI